MKVNLSIQERQILANQNKILSILDEANKESYELKIEILEKGYEREYSSMLDVYPDSEVITHEQCAETVDILNMYRKINTGIAKMSDEEKKSIDIKKIEFKGFDANNDPHYYYAEFMIEKQGKWKELSDMDLNSHTFGNVARYKTMIVAMNERLSEKKFNLNPDDIKHIVDSV